MRKDWISKVLTARIIMLQSVFINTLSSSFSSQRQCQCGSCIGRIGFHIWFSVCLLYKLAPCSNSPSQTLHGAHFKTMADSSSPRSLFLFLLSSPWKESSPLTPSPPPTHTHAHQFPFFCCWLDTLLSCNSLSFPQEAFIFNLRLTLLLDMLQKGIYYCKIKKRKIPWNYISQRELTSIWHKIHSYSQRCVDLLNHKREKKKFTKTKQSFSAVFVWSEFCCQTWFSLDESK